MGRRKGRAEKKEKKDELVNLDPNNLFMGDKGINIW